MSFDMNQRDSQRHRVYEAEFRVRSHKQNVTFKNQRDVVDFVDSVSSSQWFHQYCAPDVGETISYVPSRLPKRFRIKFHDGRHSTASAYKTLGEIRLPGKSTWAWSKFVLLHEIAHMMTWQGASHGEQFVTVLLDLTKEFIGKDFSNDLKFHYSLNGVHGPFPYVPKTNRKHSPRPATAPPVVAVAASPATPAVRSHKTSRGHRYPLHVAVARKMSKFAKHVIGG